MSVLVPLFGVGTAQSDTQPNSQPYSVTMTASASSVVPGNSLTYTITTTNSEPQVANVRLSDQINGLSNLVLTSSRGYCTDSDHLVTCQGGDMPGQGSTWVVTITGTVVGGSGTALSNTVTVNGIWSAQATSHNFTVNATTNVPIGAPAAGQLADLATSISGPTSVASGGSGTYQLTVSNFGFTKASDIFVSATLPLDWDLQPGLSVTGTSLFNCSTIIPDITCTGGALNAGANATITIPARAPLTSVPGTYKMTAAVDPENAITEPDDLQSNQNNFSQFAIAIPAGPLPTEPMTFTKTASSLAPPTDGTQIRPGDLLTYTITAKNTSPKQTATRLQISDGTQGLDQASLKVTASDLKLKCTNSNNLATCMSPASGYTLAANGTVVVTIVGKVVQPAATIIRNTATLQTLQGKVSITRNASVTTIVRPPVDLTITQFSTCSEVALLTDGSRGDCLPFRARNQFDYLVTVGNSGLDNATNVVVREVLPADVIYEGYTDLGGGFTCSEGSPVNANPTTVTCIGGAIPGALATPANYGGNTAQFRLHLTAPNSVGTISSNVFVDPYNQIAEGDETNNTFTTTTPIATGVNLTIAQTIRCIRDSRDPAVGMCDPAAPSGTIIYNILVQNIGTQDASSIKVTDILPVGARFRSAREVATPPNTFGVPYTPTHNLSCTSSNGQVNCTGGRVLGTYAAYSGPKLQLSGAEDGFVIEVMAFAPAPYGPNSSSTATATGSPILNQVSVDPQNTIPEFIDTSSTATDNLNILETDVVIPPPGDWGTFNELTVTNTQVNPVDKTDPDNPVAQAVAPNGTLDYDLTVSNYGSDPVSNIVVTDVFPTGARFRNVTADALAGDTGGFGCTFNNGVLTCANGALAAAPSIGTPTSTVIHIRLFAPPVVNAITTQYTNHAVVDPANAVAEANETNNISDASLTVSLPDPNGTGENTFNDLVVDNVQTKPATGSSVAPNGTLEYTLTVKNRGSDPVDNITVADYLPAGSRFRNVTAAPLVGGTGGFLCSANAGVVTCNGGSLLGAPDLGTPSTTTIKILLFAPDTPNDQTSEYTNHAIVDPNNTIPEGDETNNATDVSLTVENAPAGANSYNELAVTSEQFFPASDGAVAPGGTLVYHLTVPNSGTDAAQHVVLTDYLPDGTTYRKARLNVAGSTAGVTGFVCTHSAGIVTCNQGTIPGGGQAVIDVTLFAPAQPSAPGNIEMILNQALVDPNNSTPEGDETNNTSMSETAVSEGGAGSYWDIAIDEVGSDTTGEPDQFVKYVLNVKNLGTDDLFNAVVRDVLPGIGTRFAAAKDAGAPGPGAFTCALSGSVVNCTGGTLRGTLNGGATRTIEVVVYAPHVAAVLHNQAQADPDNAVVEADENNNTTLTETTTASQIDLEVDLDSSGSFSAGDTGTITAKITNTAVGGPGRSAFTVLTEVNLPVGITPLDVVAPDGTACQITENPISKVTCTTLELATGDDATFSFSVYSNTDDGKNLNALVNGDDKTAEFNNQNNSDTTAV